MRLELKNGRDDFHVVPKSVSKEWDDVEVVPTVRWRAALVSAAILVFAFATRAATPTVDCSCLSNLPALFTTSPGIVPDLGILGTNCFSTNVLADPSLGFYNQTPFPGTWLSCGTNLIQLTVIDTNHNFTTCTVPFVVMPPPATNLTFTCVSNKTVQCNTAWQFDTPVAYSTCCNPGLTVTNISTVTNGTCPKVITKVWTATDMCGNSASCSQTVTIQDSLPPAALCSGVNLVPNGDFENHAYCPNYISQLDAVYPWFSANSASPDYYNACDPGIYAGVPTNAFGFQNAFSGQAYCGAFVYGPTNNPPAPWREYIETPLLAPLIGGKTYKASFYVNTSDASGFGIADIGAYFSIGPSFQFGPGEILVTPQVVNPPSNPLTSTNAWVLVQGTFVAAGGEDHMTIGNFAAETNTTAVPLPLGVNFAYCYYDRVSVEAVCGPNATIKTMCGPPVVFDPPVGVDLCSGTNVAVTVAGTVTNSACPLTLTRTWTLTDLCGNTNTASQTVTVLNSGPNTNCPSTFTLTCASNKTVQCGSAWDFDKPVPTTTCCIDKVSINPPIRVTNGTCPQTITGTFNATDSCGNTASCSQTVTIIDTQPPAAQCSGVNLVQNGNFESYGTCPVSTSQLSSAAPWYAPTLGSPDYFNGCSPPPFSSVPTNFTGVQAALSGQAYAGAIVYYPDANTLPGSYREYIQAPLLAPLIAGRSYRVSFYVNAADYDAYAVADIGAYLSVGPVLDYTSSGGLPVVPQIANPPSNPLTSTNSWMLITGVFIAAGGEDHITLGSFTSDAATTAVPIGGTEGYSYYFFEDVSIVALCPSSVTNKTVACGAPITFDPPTGVDACSGSNVTVSVLSTVTNGGCPRAIIRTWLLTDFCGNSNTWSQTVTIIDNATPTINCGCLGDSALSLLNFNGCSGVVPNLSVLTNSPCISHGCGPLLFSQSPPAGTVVGPGTHPITVSFFTCSGASNGCVLPYQVNASAPVVICPKDMTLFTCGTGAIGWFAPMVSGNSGTVVCSPPSGSFFPVNTSTLVTCTVTNDCGLSAGCTFAITVLRPPSRWSCLTLIAIGIPVTPVGSALVTYLPDFPSGGMGVNFDNMAGSGQNGVQIDLGGAQKFTFSTVLDFNAPDGAGLTLALPPDPLAGTGPEPIVTFTRSCLPHCGWNVTQPNGTPGAAYRSVAIGDTGELFDSFTQDGGVVGTNVLVNLRPAAGVTGAVMTVTIDCRTRQVSLAFPRCDWTPDNARKGWDGIIDANEPRGSTTKKKSTTFLPSSTTAANIPVTSLLLTSSNLATVAFDNPAITSMGRKWGDGHVTLMKAYDEPDEALEFASFGIGGGVTTDLGNAATFGFRMHHFEAGGVPDQEQFFTIRGWPPGTTTNRPPPPPIFLRLAQSSGAGGTGGGGIDCAADFTSFGISNVTLQLWNGTTLVSEKPHVSASVGSAVVTLSGFPTIFSCPGNGVLSLSHTNPFVVLNGMDCGAPGCIGTELRILPESSPLTPPPAAFGELNCAVSNGMDDSIYQLQTSPACSPIPLNVTHDVSGGVTISWSADGFHLMGAENVNGPWYDLGVSSPVLLSGNHAARYFRLACD